jgi:hypothetical protein
MEDAIFQQVFQYLANKMNPFLGLIHSIPNLNELTY